MYQHILVPLDGSAGSERAARHAADLARATGARVTLLAVVPRPGWAHVPHMSEIDPQSREFAERYIGAQASLLGAGGINVEQAIGFGNVAQAIAVYTEDEVSDVDLIVMSTHGAGDPNHPGVGGTALQVLMHSNQTPVLMVRRDD